MRRVIGDGVQMRGETQVTCVKLMTRPSVTEEKHGKTKD